jgi:aconitate hydratase
LVLANSSYEDIARAASIAKQVTDKLKLKSEFTITQVLKWFDIQSSVTVLLILSKIGATVFANLWAMYRKWDREGAEKKNETQSFTRSTVTSQSVLMETNTMALGSPELVTAMAIAGDLGFNPLTDTLINEDGEEVMLDAPTGDELPKMDLMLKTKVFRASC